MKSINLLGLAKVEYNNNKFEIKNKYLCNENYRVFGIEMNDIKAIFIIYPVLLINVNKLSFLPCLRYCANAFRCALRFMLYTHAGIISFY